MTFFFKSIVKLFISTSFIFFTFSLEIISMVSKDMSFDPLRGKDVFFFRLFLDVAP